MRKSGKILTFSRQKCDLSNFNVMWSIETNIHAPVLLNLLNLLRKRDKMLGKPHILSLFPNLFNKFNRTWALM